MVHIHVARLQYLPPRECQQLLGQRCRAHRLVADLLEMPV
jgi:hypothetical protein